MFASIEVSGSRPKVADFYARWNPIVLVPNHRSYLDFVIVSWLFYVELPGASRISMPGTT